VHGCDSTLLCPDVLDGVLDKGIVIDAWVRISPVGIDLIHPVEGRSSCRPSCIRR
jgi:gas vesicle protein GvpA/GvpJ/GvpM family